MGNDNPLTQDQFYYPFVEIFVRKLQEDYANLGAGTETKYVMAGEKDRTKQRSKNIINEVLLLNDISKELTEKLPKDLVNLVRCMLVNHIWNFIKNDL